VRIGRGRLGGRRVELLNSYPVDAFLNEIELVGFDVVELLL